MLSVFKLKLKALELKKNSPIQNYISFLLLQTKKLGS